MRIKTNVLRSARIHAIEIRNSQLPAIHGVFAPAIHALRLHYVEFFSKFVESGGRQFAPLRKGDGGGSL